MKKSLNLSIILILPVLGLFVMNVFFAIGSSAKSAQLLQLEKRAQALEDENQILNEKLIHSSSLTKVNQSVEALGLLKPQNVVYLNGDEPIAWKND